MMSSQVWGWKLILCLWNEDDMLWITQMWSLGMDVLSGSGHKPFKEISLRQEIENGFGVQERILVLNYVKIRRESSTAYLEKKSEDKWKRNKRIANMWKMWTWLLEYVSKKANIFQKLNMYFQHQELISSHLLNLPSAKGFQLKQACEF